MRREARDEERKEKTRKKFVQYLRRALQFYQAAFILFILLSVYMYNASQGHKSILYKKKTEEKL